MNTATPRVGSFEALAERLRAHPDWPSEIRAQTRSLGSLLSKLDRGIELEWLADRGVVQHVMANVLGCPLGQVQQALGRRLDERDERRGSFRFPELPFARPLQLSQESLPPGLPALVRRPSAWGQLWWRAPTGSGRSLLGSWLQARGLARFEIATDAAHASALLNGSNEPVFVELAGPASSLPCPAPGTRCCVASSGVPTEGWQVVHSEPVADYLQDLFEWLERRLPRDGHFSAQLACEWVRGSVAPQLLDRFAVALGLAGLVDTLGIEKLRRAPLETVAQAFVRERLLAASQQGSAEAGWLGEQGFAALLGIARRTLTDSDATLETPRSESDFIALVPSEFQQGIDQEWARHTLTRSLSRAAARELEQALSKLQPGAFRVVRALTRAGLLRETDASGRLQLMPHWLCRVVQERAFAQLASGAPSEWGEALLSPASAAHVFASVQQRLEHDEVSLLEDVLEAEAGANLGHVAALEATFRAVGLRVLAGTGVPGELLRALYEEQRDLLIEIPGDLPSPRLEYPIAVSDTASAELHPGLFHLAALAISAELPERGVPRHPLLHAFGERSVDSRLPALFAAIEAGLASTREGDSKALYDAAIALIDRLLEHHAAQGNELLDDSRFSQLPLLWPSELLRQAARGRLEVAWLERLEQRPQLVSAAQALCAHKKRPWSEVAQALWQLWDCTHRTTPTLASFCRLGQTLWAFAPDALLAAALQSAIRGGLHVPYAALTTQQWTRLEPSLPQESAAALGDPMLWQQAPFELCMTWLGVDAVTPHLPAALTMLWQRDEAQLLAGLNRSWLQTRAANDGARLTRLLLATPPARFAALLPALREAVARPGASVGLVDATRRVLRRQVSERAPGWREAYTLLDELERRTRRVRT